MNDRIRKAFDSVRADEALVSRTKNAFAPNRRPSRLNYGKVLASAAAVLLITFAGIGAGVYFTPVSMISVDVNPSVELGVNCFERVVSVTGWGDDGARLAQRLNVRFMSFSDAVDSILENEEISGYIAGNEELHFSVAPLLDVKQSEKIAESIEKRVSENAGVYCHSAYGGDVAEAHAHGLSCGKYRAYLELSEVRPDISIEAAGEMTMREIRELTDCRDTSGSVSGENRGGHHGNGNGHHGGH